MRKDPTEFRERFKKWQSGEKVYEGGLPRFEEGTDPYNDSVDFISNYEGFSDTTYQKKGDVPTIGYGTTKKKWVNRGRITRDEARQAMMEDLSQNEALLQKNIANYEYFPERAKVVMRDVLYNVGPGNLFNKSPKFIEALNAGKWQEAADQMDWDENKPGFSKGAKRRNDARKKMFLQDLLGKKLNVPSDLVKSLANMPQYNPPFEYQEDTTTDYSTTNRAGGKLNAWNGAQSPSYGGAYVRMPSIYPIVERATFKPLNTYRQ